MTKSLLTHKKLIIAGIFASLLIFPVILSFIQERQNIRSKAQVESTTYPMTPPAQICGNADILTGPATQPEGSVRVPEGDNFDFFNQEKFSGVTGKTYWFAPGTHTLSDNPFGQIEARANSTYIGAPGAILDGRNINRYAFTGNAEGVKIKYLTIRNFMAPGDEGVVNHDRGAGWVIERNTVEKNGGAGVYLGNNNKMLYNCLADNSQYGFQGDGTTILIDHNEITRNNTYDYETKQPGCGCSGGSKFWAAKDVTIRNNWVHHNYNVGIWADNNNVGFLIEGNYINDNRGPGIEYETSYNARIINNKLLRNAIHMGQAFQARGDGFPVGAIYLSEAHGDSRANIGIPSTGNLYDNIEVSGNLLENNWAGVVGWENADRFGHDESANTSKRYTTLLIDPANKGLDSPRMKFCGDPAAGGKINTEPYFSDCRWMSKNFLIKNNVFKGDKAAIGCNENWNFCMVNAIFSNSGSVPSWSPYKGNTVRENITFNQNNKFINNTYTGPWSFVAWATDRGFLTWNQWRSSPYNQDAGSTFNGSDFSHAPSPSVREGPTTPQNFHTTSVTTDRVDFAWDRSTNTAAPISGYELKRNGAAIGTTGSTQIADINPAKGQTYIYTIEAYSDDDGFRHSPPSTPLTVTIPEEESTPTSIAPSSTPTHSPGNTSLNLNLLLHGIGKGGDSANPNAGGNNSPQRARRNVEIEVFNSQNQLVLTKNGLIGFNPAAGNFLGVIDAGGTLTSGLYTVKVKVDQFLKVIIPGIQNISTGRVNVLPQAVLITGDMNNDNKINALDYNILVDCYADLTPAANCSDPAKKLMADITDDGAVNQFDYNLFLRELTNIRGE